ncbi:thioesterase II family protein [Pseudomonas syringae group genomosp. 3]|uniref:thioesterase II family protein n=1 Tax=Pseudomonas syringae group genomosp. 3 TaxID=251701 RepID=UPI000EFFC857|nr:thioesterase domain-containing protein [Pseudomonas syringae group genomosp. 3]RMU34006.1 hypothetical protein ALP30_200019 [Pseudomonas syringae pv. primulae]
MCLIFCLPHAGGGAHHYQGWKNFLSPSLDWQPVDYAGHFSRMEEDSYISFEQAVQDLAMRMLQYADGQPFAIFGHSMGGAFAYEIAQFLSEQSLSERVHFIIVSSVVPPFQNDFNTLRYFELSDQDFIKHLVDIGGMSSDMIERADAISEFTSLIRRDYKLYYEYTPKEHAPLLIPLHSFWGDQEIELNSKMPRWSDYTELDSLSTVYPGDHFYWRNCLEVVAAEISSIAGEVLARIKEK